MGCTDSICVLFENEQNRFCLISRAGFSQSSDWFLSSKHEQKPFRCFLHPSSIIHYRSRSPLISILPRRHAVKNRTNRKYHTFGSSMDSVVSIRFNGSHNFYLMANFLFIFLSFFIEIILSFRLVRKNRKYTQYIMIYQLKKGCWNAAWSSKFDGRPLPSSSFVSPLIRTSPIILSICLINLLEMERNKGNMNTIFDTDFY